MYESLLLDPVAPLTCPAQASHGETALTPLAADRLSKCKAGQLIRLIIITSHVQHRDFWSGWWRVLLYRFNALKCDLAPEPQLVEKQCPTSRMLLTAIYLFILSSFLLFSFSFLEFLGRTRVCCLPLSAALPVSPLQPSCPLMFGKLSADCTVVKSLGFFRFLFFLFLHPSRLTHISSWHRGLGGGWGWINLS